MGLSCTICSGYFRLILVDFDSLISESAIEKYPTLHPYSPLMLYVHGGNTLVLGLELILIRRIEYQ